MKRLALYVFWEKDGIVRDYVTYYLKALKEVASDITVIVNGKLSAEGRKKLEAEEYKIIVRENHGIDFGAWRTAINQTGWDKLAKYDELILCNCSCFGPIYPFSEMFTEMEKRKCDFWGITKHPNVSSCVPTTNIRIKEHIQSYFMVFKNNVISSQAYKDWWNNLLEYDILEQEIAHHEVQFSGYLQKAGFISDTYIDCDKYFKICNYLDIQYFYTDKLLSEDRMPLIKRKIFKSINIYTPICIGLVGKTIMEYLQKTGIYPLSCIWQDLLATEKMSVIKESLHLNYVLSETQAAANNKKQKVALLCYAYYPDLCAEMTNYIRSMPESSDVYIISSRQETLDTYKEVLKDCKFNHTEFRLKPNRGRDVSAYLITGRDIFETHDLICCVHDKKSKQLEAKTAEDFLYHNMTCCLKSRNYIENIITQFADNQHLGLLVPPTVCFGPFRVLHTEIVQNEAEYRKLYQQLDIRIPFDDHPVAPFGSMFWIRGKAMKTLLSKQWKYDDFPDEPLPVDGTISHAIERIYPCCAQNDGYYTGWVMPQSYASVYLTSLLQKITPQINNAPQLTTNNNDFGSKKKNIWKLFNCIPLFAQTTRGGRKVCKLFGMPVWKVRRMANGFTTKYYLCGIPLLKVTKK